MTTVASAAVVAAAALAVAAEAACAAAAVAVCAVAAGWLQQASPQPFWHRVPWSHNSFLTMSPSAHLVASSSAVDGWHVAASYSGAASSSTGGSSSAAVSSSAAAPSPQGLLVITYNVGIASAQWGTKKNSTKWNEFDHDLRTLLHQPQPHVILLQECGPFGSVVGQVPSDSCEHLYTHFRN